MFWLIGIAAWLILGIPIVFIYLFTSISSLKRQIIQLQAQLDGASGNADVSRVAEQDIVKEPTRPKPTDTLSIRQSIVAQTQVEEDLDAVEEKGVRKPEKHYPPRSFLFNKERIDAFKSWISANWIYVVSAISLALAGIFLVQESIERGLLSPVLRVSLAAVFGVALVAGGEFIRRRYGDDSKSIAAYLPSTFSSAGIVIIFGAIVSARSLYGLIGPEVAFFAMMGTGLIALAFGWLYGPLLTAIGLIGATVAPFIVDGSDGDPRWLLLYFGFITVIGLGIDSIRRWAWISLLALSLGFGAASLLMVLVGNAVSDMAVLFIVYVTFLAIASIAIPLKSLLKPECNGSMISSLLKPARANRVWPDFPTRLIAGSFLITSGLIWITSVVVDQPITAWSAICALSFLVMAILIWARNASALLDLVLFPAFALLMTIASAGDFWKFYIIGPFIISERPLDPMVSYAASILIGLGLVLSTAAAWRSIKRSIGHIYAAMGAAAFAPAIALSLEFFWNPTEILGTEIWGLHAFAVAGIMILIAWYFARADGIQERMRVSFAAISAISCITYAFVVLLSPTALTLAFAVGVLSATWLDRRFDLKLMSLYIYAGLGATSYRLIADPGLFWAQIAPMPEWIFVYSGVVLCFGLAWRISCVQVRPVEKATLGGAAISSAGLLISLVLYRLVESIAQVQGEGTHWYFGINATIWLFLGLIQFRPLNDVVGFALRIRQIFAVANILIANAYLFLGLTYSNPLFFWGDPVIGPPLINSLLLAYILPIVPLLLMDQWSKPHKKRLVTYVIAALGLFWLALSIRHFWHGGEDMALVEGIEQPELYSYTVAILCIGAIVFYRALIKGNAALRRIGLVIIGIAAVKVFLVDISNLGGLIRVFSFLLLGFSLAGLAWLDRWAHKETNKPPQVRKVMD